MLLKRFEDLECWQVARDLTKTIYKYAKGSKFSKDYKLVDQICSAAISIMNNISEGFDAKSRKEFIRFLSYARRSCSEVQNCLYVSLDQEYITSEAFQSGYAECTRTRQIIDGPIRYLNKPASQPTNNKNRTNGPTGSRTNGPTNPRANGHTNSRANGHTGARANGQTTL